MKILKKPSKKRLTIIVIAVFITLLVAAAAWYLLVYNRLPESTDDKTITTDNNPVQVTEKPKINTFHMVAMGDMLAHDTIIANAKTGDSYDFSKYFANIRPAYKDADVVFCNQEGLSAGEAYGISGYPSFNAPTVFSSDLKTGAGCNAINLANNHMGDKGVSATNATIDVWSKLNPLLISGANKSVADQNKVSYATVSGIKLAFLAFADFNNNSSTPSYSINIYHNEDLLRQLVTAARANADVVIVSMHWGVEDSNIVSADQQTQVNLLSSLGVDVIIGTGPHVLQKVSVVDRPDGGKTVVWYSIGNMLSSQLNIKELIGGIAGFDVTKDANNKVTVTNLTFIPTYMHYEWTATQAANGDLLARKNAMIYLLSSAADPLSRSLFNTTVAEQKQYVVDTLGNEVKVQ